MLILWGSLSLSYDLFAAGVIDKVRLVVAPVALGAGRGVFPAGPSASRLKLIGNETVGGLIAVDYELEQML